MMITRAVTIFWVGAVLTASVMRVDAAPKPTVESIGTQVQCSCGCVAPLSQCPMIDCAEKAEMRAFITKEIADGRMRPPFSRICRLSTACRC